MARALADAREGMGRAAVVTGDRGVGKSRIVQHFLGTEVNRDWTVFAIRGTPDGLNVPSRPMARLLRAWASVEERDFQSDIAS